jgi:hypothetical protein
LSGIKSSSPYFGASTSTSPIIPASSVTQPVTTLMLHEAAQKRAPESAAMKSHEDLVKEVNDAYVLVDANDRKENLVRDRRGIWGTSFDRWLKKKALTSSSTEFDEVIRNRKANGFRRTASLESIERTTQAKIKEAKEQGRWEGTFRKSLKQVLNQLNELLGPIKSRASSPPKS